MKVLVVFGTRPEAIKLAPVVFELRSRGVDVDICVTGQHRQMLDQMLDTFGLVPDYDLKIMQPNQTLAYVTSSVLAGLDEILEHDTSYDYVFVQGDTISAFAAALSAFLHKIPVAHVEAGLRTDSIYDPFPEEMSRRLISQLARLHFAPTRKAVDALLRSGCLPEYISQTGNTVIDALLWVRDKNIPLHNNSLQPLLNNGLKTILLTSHRRENLGEKMTNIFRAVSLLLQKHPEYQVIFPVHLNPTIQEAAHNELADNDRVHLLPPLEYPDLVRVMAASEIVMTDSGGIQEEAPAFGKPVMVLRETTERPEGVEEGTARLVGTNEQAIVNAVDLIIENRHEYEKMSNAINPYGDGTAAKKIVDIVMSDYEVIPRG